MVYYEDADVQKKQFTLEVTNAVVELAGESWLMGPMVVPDDQKVVPSDRWVELMRILSLDSSPT